MRCGGGGLVSQYARTAKSPRRARVAVAAPRDYLGASQNGHFMVVVVDTVSATPLRPRHPEKANRPDALSPPKPDWIRVRAPNTRGYDETRNIVKENLPVS